MHDEYWQKVRVEAENRLVSLFGDNWAEGVAAVFDNGAFVGTVPAGASEEGDGE